MMEIDEIRKALQDRRMNVVAKAIGCHYNTITYIRDGKTKNPGVKIVKDLSDYLNKNG